MHMKKSTAFFLFAMLFATCQTRNTPDISAIHVDLKLERFDKAFFSIDSNNIPRSLFLLNQQYPYFTNDFIVNILGGEPLSDTSINSFKIARAFFTTYLPIKDSLEKEFANLDWLEKEAKKSFAYVRYYFPQYVLPPKLVTYIGPFDAPAAALTRYTVAAGLQLYAGGRFSFYRSAQGQELYPAYISRRFEKQYILPNCMKAVAEDIFPDTSASRPLIEQMIEKGKHWWLVKKFMPDCPDSLITGYTQKQLKFCKENEGQIWNQILQADIFTIDQDLIKNYIGEAPNTQGMPESSPGNIGQWVGLQIMEKYEEKNPSLSPPEIMRTNSRKIFEETKYKPK
jgi:hypothetical protein